MNILIGTVLLALLAGWIWRRLETEENRHAALMGTLDTLRWNLPRLTVALIGAGFFAELLPEEAVGRLLGEEAGGSAIWVATAMGVITPGGPFVAFALAAAALEIQATIPAILAYVTSWGLFAFTKLMSHEFAMMGGRFLALRIGLSLPLPLLVGYGAMVVL